MYEPKGFKFFDQNFGEMILIEDETRDFNGWLCHKGKTGDWITLRKATKDDLEKLENLRKLKQNIIRVNLII